MRKAFVHVALILVLTLSFMDAALAQEPRILVTKPADGTVAVAPNLSEISIFFSRPMDTGSWSLLEVPDHAFPPVKMSGTPWKDDQTFVLELGRLEPGTRYGVQLNSKTKQGFKSADGSPLAPATIRFETAGEPTAGEPAPAPKPQEPQPDVVTVPADGAADVPIDVGEIRITFKEAMDTRAWSFLEIKDHEFPPAKMTSPPWQDDKTFVLPIGRLKPAADYGFQLNNAKEKGFRTAAGEPLAPTVIRFKTVSREAQKIPEAPPKTPEKEQQEKPKPGPLSDEERVALHLVGGFTGVFFHELGHGLIDLFNLPVTGREEDVVDEFSTLLLLHAREEGADFIPEMIYGFADFFYRMGKKGGETPYWDEHTGDMVRFGNILCLLYGSNPEEFKDLAKTFEMPERRQYFCKKEFPEKMATWEKLLKGHLKENGAEGAGRMSVEYGETKSEFGRQWVNTLKEERLFEQLAEGINEGLALPEDVTIVPMDCGEANAYWDPQNHRVVMCNELMEFYAKLLQEDATGGTGGTGDSGGSGGGGNTPANSRVAGFWLAKFNVQTSTLVFKLLLNDKGQYDYVHEQWIGGMRYYTEEETGLYTVDAQTVTFQVRERTDSRGVGSKYALKYSLQGNNLIFHSIPTLNGGDLIFERAQ